MLNKCAMDCEGAGASTAFDVGTGAALLEGIAALCTGVTLQPIQYTIHSEKQRESLRALSFRVRIKGRHSAKGLINIT